jgi:hypothetical protein
MLNAKISVFDQKISTFDYGLTNEEFIVFHSSAQTSMSKLQNSYNESELDFFKLLLTKITGNEDLNITPREALNISSNIQPKLNKMRAQKLLDSWIAIGYFHQHTDNLIYIGVKTLTEFKEILQKMELAYCRTCLLCENIAVWVRIGIIFSFNPSLILFSTGRPLSQLRNNLSLKMHSEIPVTPSKMSKLQGEMANTRRQ